MNPLDLVNLVLLMERTSGHPAVKVGIIDGPVVTEHPDLTAASLHEISGNHAGICTKSNSMACLHGTFIAGILSAKRNSPAPAICPNCTHLIRPIFVESSVGLEHMPGATPHELAAAIIECMDAGAQVINLSLALTQPSSKGEMVLEEALNQAVKRGVLVVAAAGNQGTLASSVITRHRWVIPVVACNLAGRPTNGTNLGISIGERGLGAPGEGITSLRAEGGHLTLGGTSVAAPFVTGAIALLWSEFRMATASQIKLAIAPLLRRAGIVPPLLNAEAAYQTLLQANGGR